MLTTRPFAGAAIRLAGFAMLLSATSAVQAADLLVSADPEQSNSDKPKGLTRNEFLSRWELIVGAGGKLESEYEGGEKFAVSPIPSVSLGFDDWLQMDPGGLSVTVLRKSAVSLDARLGYESGRDEDDGDRLKGLGDVDFGVTAGLKASYQWGPLEFYGEFDKTMGGSGGLTGTFGLDYGKRFGNRFILGIGASATLADENHMESYFGIDAAQAAASGLPEYKAEAGLKRIDLEATGTYLLGDHWIVRGEAGAGLLVGDAAGSPIVENEFQPSAMLSLGYKF